jgi:hypothetical protein
VLIGDDQWRSSRTSDSFWETSTGRRSTCCRCRCGYATGRVEDVQLDIDLPFGLQTGRSFPVQRLSLDPQDGRAGDLDFV